MIRRFVALTVLSLGLLGPGGLALAQNYNAGMTAYETGDYERAAQIWEPLAESGNATAQYSLGKLFETGNMDLPRDYGRAVEWYRLSAAQGVAAAQNNLGLMYAQGRGVARDPVRAVELWQAAAKQDHPMAQFNLALAYFRGEGVESDKRQAEKWFRRAAELGLADAQYALGQIKLHGLVSQADRDEALHWYQLAAAQGHTKARDQAERLRREGATPRLAQAGAASARKAQTTLQPAGQAAKAPAPAAKAVKAAPKAAAPALKVPAPPPQAQTAAAAPPAARAPAMPPPPEAKTPAAAGKTKPTIGSTLDNALKDAARTQEARATPAGVQPGAGAGKVRLWLLSSQDEGAALQYLRTVEARHAKLFGDMGGAVTPVDLGDGGVYYRVVAGAYPTWEAGRQACQEMRAAEPGVFCKVLPGRP